MSRWTTCGAWEGHAILDFLKENESDVKPDTIHADTQGQSSAIFGLAYLLGIQLLPRIRDWKGKNFYRPAPETRFQHIDSLFTSQVDWSLIEAMLSELLRVAVSIKGGALLPSDILRRLGSYSRKNKLYFALRELGYVVRTMFLLRYRSGNIRRGPGGSQSLSNVAHQPLWAIPTSRPPGSISTTVPPQAPKRRNRHGGFAQFGRCRLIQ